MKIAISGLTGCGNSTASKLVAEALGLKRFNYTFHNLAEDLDVPFASLHAMADSNPKYDLLLDKKQIEFALANGGCVVGTRLAVFLEEIAPKLGMQKPRFDLRVWLQAPLQTRAERVAERDARGFENAMKEVVYRDDSNRTRYKRLYGIAYEMPKGCLRIDNENLDAAKTAEKIIAAAEKLQAKSRKG